MLNWLRDEQFYILDTETTGLGKDAEIVELALINQDGEKIIDTLVKPVNHIPKEATAIHGITTEQAKEEGAYWADVCFQLYQEFCSGHDRKDLVIYNSDYDVRLVNQTSELHKTTDIFSFQKDLWSNMPHVTCAMLEYAERYGQWDDYRNSFKWQSLVNACAQQNVQLLNAHRAAADCLMTLNLIRKCWLNGVKGIDSWHAV